MKKYIIPILIISLIGIFGGVYFARAGFGVSPPYINNDRLKPGSSFEETIYLVRGQPTEELMAEVSIDAPEIKDWITIEKGLRFPLPKGIQQFPMKVIINVPSDAAFGNYQGYIRVVAVSGGQPGQVSTLLGGRIDVSLTITEKGFSDFKIKGNPFIPDFEKGEPLAVLIITENTGNTPIRPSKVHLDVYDVSHRNVLASGDITEMDSVAPFETKQIKGQISADLDLGQYWADITIYKGEESLGLYKILFNVIPKIEKGATSKNEKKSLLISYLPYIGIGIIILIILLLLPRMVKKNRAFSKEKIVSEKKEKINERNRR